MCGVVGLLDPDGARSRDELAILATTMAEQLAHRGPDDHGAWVDADAGIALGSRRLAVIDLSPEGHQPMLSASGRFVVAYNGEIYNFKSLRARLEKEGARFRGGSDTEVLLEAVDHWGLERTLQELNGMFAFALWDRAERALHLARDRLGEKPLYFTWIGHALAFGSELKALRAVPGFSPAVDRRALASYLRLSCVPAPSTIYEGVRQLRPGSVLTLRGDQSGREQALPTPYWSAFDVAARGTACPRSEPPAELVDELETLLSDAVALRLQADVPVGVFLSGGLDSSTVAALAQARSGGSLRTFTIAFEHASYDESEHAAAVARHLGTDHTELRLTAGDARRVIPELPRVYDDPFADTSQIPTYLVSRLAREQVTVSLSGDGGDELFGGYNRHAWGGPILRATRRCPEPLRRGAAALLAAPSPSSWDRLFETLGGLLPRSARLRIPGIEVQKLASVLPAGDSAQLYRILTSTWQEPSTLVRGLRDVDEEQPAGVPRGVEDVASELMYLDLVSYLPDDILVKLDRASMAVSLESRVPLLDHRVVELAWQLPVSLKVKGRTGKWILREVLGRHVPEELTDRPKAGFGLPIGSWLRGPLRPWAEELLAPGRLEAEGYLEPAVVQRCWREHLGGRRDLSERLWTVLMFQAWLDSYAS